jgi:hypothetical protein
MADATESLRRRNWTRGVQVLCVSALALWTLGLSSCGDDPAAPIPGSNGTGGSGGGQDAAVDDDTCYYSEVRECHVQLDTNNGILTCLDGVQVCGKEGWGPCEGTVTARPLYSRSGESESVLDGKNLPWVPPPQGARPMSLSSAANCLNNACDPSCQVFDEDPTSPVTPPGTPIVVSYSQGDLDNPSTNVAGFVNKGLKDPAHPPNGPCTGTASCQYDYYCDTATGYCKPWADGATWSDCNKPDLTAAPACPGRVPLCNRGKQTAPAGVKIAVFNGNSVQMQADLGKCEAGTITGGTKAGECVSLEPVEPGSCIDVLCPAGLLSGTQAIMVNPPQPHGSTSPIDECYCENNWTYYNNNATCVPVSCVATAETAAMKPVNMYIIMDNSGSMGASNIWIPAKNGFRAFFQSPDAAGLNVALRFFGNGCGTSGSPNCSIGACATPLVPLGQLTAATGAADPHETLLVNTVNATNTGTNGTPIYESVGGLAQWGVANATANPSAQTVVVFLTDGDQTGCMTNLLNDTQYWSQTRDFASNARASRGVLTFVIGLYGSNQTKLNALAAAGGTGTAYYISTTNQAALEAQLLTALNAIRASTMSCTFNLPNPSTLDPNDVTLNYTDSGGNSKTTYQKLNAAACTGANIEWYLNDNATPTQATLCPTFCSTAQADVGAKIQVLAGCPKIYSPMKFSNVYEGACPPGTMIQWQYMSYDTTVPAGASVVFEGRTAATAAELGPPDTLLATATSTNQLCPMSGPAPCPVNIYQKLGTPTAFARFLEVITTLNPTSDGLAAPKVNSWEITYSCPSTE